MPALAAPRAARSNQELVVTMLFFCHTLLEDTREGFVAETESNSSRARDYECRACWQLHRLVQHSDREGENS